MNFMKALKKLIFIISIMIVIPVFTIKSNAMTIVIDPGHGGNDTGAEIARNC